MPWCWEQYRVTFFGGTSCFTLLWICSMLTTSCLEYSSHSLCIVEHRSHINFPQSRQKLVASRDDFVHFSHCNFCGSCIFLRASRISKRLWMWKAVWRQDTSVTVGGRRVDFRQVGQCRERCPSSLVTSCWRQSLQPMWKHCSSLGSLKRSRQMAQVSCSSSFLRAGSATVFSSAIVTQLLTFMSLEIYNEKEHYNEINFLMLQNSPNKITT